jgi:hypothetical protein
MLLTARTIHLYLNVSFPKSWPKDHQHINVKETSISEVHFIRVVAFSQDLLCKNLKGAVSRKLLGMTSLTSRIPKTI